MSDVQKALSVKPCNPLWHSLSSRASNQHPACSDPLRVPLLPGTRRVPMGGSWLLQGWGLS